MSANVHVVPVGFDRDRLVAPLAKGGVRVDEIYLLHGQGDASEQRNADFSARMLEFVRRDIEMTIPALSPDAIHVDVIPDVHRYDAAYEFAVDLFLRHLKKGDDLFVNISSMPRTVSFAFAAAANNLLLEDERRRGRIKVYYTAPEEYLMLRMLEILHQQSRFLNRLDETSVPAELVEDLEQVLKATDHIVDTVRQFGWTKGAKTVNGSYMCEIPFTSGTSLRDFEKRLILALGERDEVNSVTELATFLSDIEPGDFAALKSKVVYNIRNLVDKGFVEIETAGRSHRPRLTHAGRLWYKMHDPERPRAAALPKA